MNVYDFDGTIYDGDSSRDFFFFCLKRHPLIAWRAPVQVFGIVLYALGIISKTRGKELFFSFLKAIEGVDSLVDDFWIHHKRKIMPWYLKQVQESDLVISASPEFLLIPICKQLSVSCIASLVAPNTGRFLSPNCHGAEKVSRYMENYENEKINTFYSDSLSDAPLAKIAETSFLVQHDRISKFPLV